MFESIGKAAVFGFFIVVAISLLLGLPVWLLWNWVCVDVLKLPSITFLQAIGISLLCRILFTKIVSNQKGD